MPYAALHPDCETLTDPQPGDIERLAANPGLPGVIAFSVRDSDLSLFRPLAAHLQRQAVPRARGAVGTVDGPALPG